MEPFANPQAGFINVKLPVTGVGEEMITETFVKQLFASVTSIK